MDKYKNSEELQNSKFAQKLGSVLIFTDDNNLKVVDKVMNDENLYNKSNVVDNLPSIFQKAKNPDDMDIINKILEKEEFINDKKTMDSLPNLMRDLNWNTDDAHDSRCKVLNKVLDDKNLYGNKSLMSKMPDILSDVYYDEQAELVNTILDDDKLLNNEKVMHSLHGWLFSMEEIGHINMERYTKIKEMLHTL